MSCYLRGHVVLHCGPVHFATGSHPMASVNLTRCANSSILQGMPPVDPVSCQPRVMVMSMTLLHLYSSYVFAGCKYHNHQYNIIGLMDCCVFILFIPFLTSPPRPREVPWRLVVFSLAVTKLRRRAEPLPPLPPLPSVRRGGQMLGAFPCDVNDLRINQTSSWRGSESSSFRWSNLPLFG